jgi:hypothetical protein
LLADAETGFLPERKGSADEEGDRQREPSRPDQGGGVDNVVEQMNGEEQVQTDRQEDQRNEPPPGGGLARLAFLGQGPLTALTQVGYVELAH